MFAGLLACLFGRSGSARPAPATVMVSREVVKFDVKATARNDAARLRGRFISGLGYEGSWYFAACYSVSEFRSAEEALAVIRGVLNAGDCEFDVVESTPGNTPCLFDEALDGAAPQDMVRPGGIMHLGNGQVVMRDMRTGVLQYA